MTSIGLLVITGIESWDRIGQWVLTPLRTVRESFPSYGSSISEGEWRMGDPHFHYSSHLDTALI